MTDRKRDQNPMRGGAIWCELHTRWECSKRTKTDPICHGIAISGLNRCRMHAGEKLEVAKAKGEAVTAWSALSGQPVVSHTEAVLGMLQMSWLRAHLYASLLERQFTDAQEAEQTGETGVDGGGGDPALGPGRGLVGHTRGAVKDIGIYVTGEAARALTVLEGQERDRVVRYAKTAHDMGIAEQQVKLAEQQGVMLAEVIRRTADGLLAAALGMVAELVVREGDDGLDGILQRFADVIETSMRAAWPGWLEQIVRQQIAAVTGATNE